jgi:hypothetical protein
LLLALSAKYNVFRSKNVHSHRIQYNIVYVHVFVSKKIITLKSKDLRFYFFRTLKKIKVLKNKFKTRPFDFRFLKTNLKPGYI